tara:strand:+ start:372 stop:551 length:180 start_codon:yes stop_codon:yes gene_type:complete
MNIARILKNKWIWVAVFFVFIGYQLMEDFLIYEYLGWENISTILDEQIKATNAGTTKQD